jgi:hypothetical protein
VLVDTVEVWFFRSMGEFAMLDLFPYISDSRIGEGSTCA